MSCSARTNTAEGSIKMFMMRILVPDEYEEQARKLLIDADLGHCCAPSSRAEEATFPDE